MPEALAGIPAAAPVNASAPSDPIRQPAIVPEPEFNANRNRLFSLSARSVGAEPGWALTPCGSRVATLPSRDKLKPVMTPLPVSEVNANLSFSVITTQQAAP